MFFTKTAPSVASKSTSCNPCDESDLVEVSVPVVDQQNSFQNTLTVTTRQLIYDPAIRSNAAEAFVWCNVP